MLSKTNRAEVITERKDHNPQRQEIKYCRTHEAGNFKLKQETN